MSHLSFYRKVRAWGFSLCALGSLAACNSYHTDFEQNVRVALLEADHPVRGVTFGLFNAAKCEGESAVGMTDEAGVAKIRRTARRGKYAVLLEEIALCEKVGATWRLLWSETLDPPDQLVLKCEGISGRRSCRDSRDVR